MFWKYGNQRWLHSMTTPWRRLLLSWHQVEISFLGLKMGRHHHNILSQACRPTITQLSLLTELMRLTWTNLLRYKTIHVGLTYHLRFNRTWFVSFWSGAHPKCPWHLELGSTGWHFFHQEPGTTQHHIMLLSTLNHQSFSGSVWKLCCLRHCSNPWNMVRNLNV